MSGPIALIGLLIALVLLFLGVGQVTTAEATYIPLVSGSLRLLLEPLDLFFMLFVAVLLVGVIYAAAAMLMPGRR